MNHTSQIYLKMILAVLQASLSLSPSLSLSYKSIYTYIYMYIYICTHICVYARTLSTLTVPAIHQVELFANSQISAYSLCYLPIHPLSTSFGYEMSSPHDKILESTVNGRRSAHSSWPVTLCECFCSTWVRWYCSMQAQILLHVFSGSGQIALVPSRMFLEPSCLSKHAYTFNHQNTM